MRKNTIFILILFVIFIGPNNSLIAQDDNVPLPKSLQPYKPRKDDAQGERKITFFAGGGFGLQLSTKYVGVDVSPQIGLYPIVKWLALGINGTYKYSYDGYYDYSLHIYGGGLFVEGYPIKWLILHAGYEYLNSPDPVVINGRVETSRRIGTHAVMLGPGYRQQLTDKVNVYFLALFNLYQDKTSMLYTGYIPILRVGITVDF